MTLAYFFEKAKRANGQIKAWHEVKIVKFRAWNLRIQNPQIRQNKWNNA